MIENNVNQSTTFHKIGSALLNGLTSFLLTMVNKTVLTTFKFPSFLFLGLGQLIANIVILYVGKISNTIDFPNITRKQFQMVFPLPLIYIGNMVFGLGGTQSLSLPMFTALRGISVLVTLVLEFSILGSKPGWIVGISVFSIITGAVLAAFDDLAFHLEGYIYIMINNVLTGLYQVYIKKMLNADKMGKYGLMFYNSLFSLIPIFAVNLATGDFKKAIQFDKWSDTMFVFQFTLSCVMGFLLAFSIFLCTLYNSALTTSMVGTIKNVLITFIGMLIGGDYIFSWINFIGLNISVTGSLLYSYAAFNSKKSEPATEEEDEETTETVLLLNSE